MNKQDFEGFLLTHLPMDKFSQVSQVFSDLEAHSPDFWEYETGSPDFMEHVMLMGCYGHLVHLLGYDLASLEEGSGVFDEKIFFAGENKNRCMVICGSVGVYFERTGDDPVYNYCRIPDVVAAGWNKEILGPKNYIAPRPTQPPDATMMAHIMYLVQALAVRQ